jgi:hypothetical protein
MNLTPSARVALAKQIRLLASNHDGEVLAAARAIGRSLKAAGHDLHDMAQEFVETPSAAPAPSGGFRDPFGDDDGDPGWETMVEVCVRNPGRFTVKEREFLASMECWRGEPTERQSAWLAALFKRARRAA